MQLICCDRPAARHQLSYEVQAPLQSVISAICLLGHDMSAWQQSVSSVCQHSSSAAMCLLSLAQLSCYLKAQLQPVSSAVRSAATCQLRWYLSSQLQRVGWAVVYLLFWTPFTRLWSVNASVICQLGCDMSAQLYSVSSLPLVQFAASSIRLVRVKLSTPRHNAFTIAQTPPSAHNNMCCHWCLLNVAFVIHYQLMIKQAVNPMHICALFQCSTQKRITSMHTQLSSFTLMLSAW